MHTLMGTAPEALKLKASLFTLTTCHLFNLDILLIQKQLQDLVEQTPHFFQQLPIILDLSSLRLAHGQTPDFPVIISCLRRYGLIPIGIRCSNEEQQKLATETGLAILSNLRIENTEVNPTKFVSPSTSTAKLITEPVRSGQQIYAKNSDLIVLASVSPGAELLADGNIHIYGRLKGRALAGITGNQNTHIFCKNLEAELVSIAGNYWLSEDLHGVHPTPHKNSVHIYLQQERLQIKTLN